LERRGFQVAIAVDGAQGVAMAQSEKPALVLMDMSLPAMDGWTATRTLGKGSNHETLASKTLAKNGQFNELDELAASPD